MELLVVVSIIALLIGIVTAGITVLRSSGKDSQARTMLAGLSGLAGHMETSLGQPLNHLKDQDTVYNWANNKAYNVEGVTGKGSLDDDDTTSQTNAVYKERANLYMERFIWAANQMPAIRSKLPSLGKGLADSDGDGFLDLVDPWGTPIAYGYEVRHPSTDDPRSGSDNFTEDDFLPRYQGAFFASAGKDKQWGTPFVRGEFKNQSDWDDYILTDEYKHTLDNLYSFDIDGAAAQRGD